MNIIQAKHALAQMSDDEKLLLAQAERGVSVADVDADVLKSMHDKDYVKVVPYSHPQAGNAIPGLIPTEDGRKVLQALAEFKPEEHVDLKDTADALAVEQVEEKVAALEEPVNFDERAAEREPDVTWHQGRKERKSRAVQDQEETPATEILSKKG